MNLQRYVRHSIAVALVLFVTVSFPGFWFGPVAYAEDTSSSSSTSVPEGDKLIQLTPPSISSGGNSITVKGRLVFYPPGSSDPEPIKRAWVEVKDNEWWVKPDVVVASGYTDYNGYFSFSGINNDDGWFQDGRDIYIEVFAENWAVDVVDNPGWVYLFLKDPTYHANNKDHTVGDVDDHSTVDFGWLTPENPGAYNILNTVLTGWSFLSAQQGINAPKVKVFFKDWFTPARSYYYPEAEPTSMGWEFLYGLIVELGGDLGGVIGIHIADDYGDQWHEDIILHEYGHFVMDEYADFWPPTTVLSHDYTTTYNPEHAWGEGWAHFFSAAARDWAGYPVADYRDNPAIEGKLDQNNVLKTPVENYQGDSVEAAVAGILWDIYDPYSASEPQDYLGLGFDPIWDILVNYRPWDIHDFWDGFLARNPISEPLNRYKINRLWKIYIDLHGVSIPDNVPPNNPTEYSSSHTVGVPSWGERIRIVVSGAYDDLSGVDGYSVVWDNSPFTLPPETTNELGGVIISPTLSEGIEWYFHLRTKDYAGNWAPDALHGGPFYVKIETPDDDTTGPSFSNPTSYYFQVTPGSGFSPAIWVLRLCIDVTDPSGISDVRFDWFGLYPSTGSSGNTYWIDWYYGGGWWYEYYTDSWFHGSGLYLGQTISWQVQAYDDDNEGWLDRAWAISPLYNTQVIEPPTGLGNFLGVDISIEPSSRVAELGTFTTYTLFISNIGFIPYAYSLTLQRLDSSWRYRFSANPVIVNPKQTVSVTLTLASPYASIILTDYVFTVTATSLGDPSIFDTTDAVISVVGPFFVITADSPVDILVTAPNGLRVGYNPETGTSINEIPRALYSGQGSEPQIVQIPNSLVGFYLIDIFGTGTGTYTITMESLASDGSTIDTVTWTGTTEPGQHNTQTVEVEPDGTFADMTPPTTEITLTGTLGLNDWYISDVIVTLTATDHLSGVALTQYSFDGATWITYAGQFTINVQGTTTIYYNSTDNTGNVEETKSTTMKIDTTLPTVNIVNPPAGYALQDGVTFRVSATDIVSGISSVKLSIRDAAGNPVGFEDMSPTFDLLTNLWSLNFDTLMLPDGYYTATATAMDNAGNIASTTVPYSIRNWAVIELLPASERNKAGRTMPVKFALRVVASVDPNQPFVYNEELTIQISDSSSILQTSTFGTHATDYRINPTTELYITNFKTLKTPKQYTATILRQDFNIGSFTFTTVK